MVYHTVILLFSGIIGLSAVEVDFMGEWKTGIGWELVCSWTFPLEDRLQSVHMYRGSAQFKIYRPELSGPSITEDFNTTDSLMSLKCIAREQRRGTCVLHVQPHTPPASITVYACEVSGERPKFQMMKKEYELEAFVPSTDAALLVSRQAGEARVLLNCTATGIPAPALVWTVGDQTVQGDFSGKTWNLTTRLSHAWSSLALASPTAPLPVRCVPEQRTYRRALSRGPPANYLLMPPTEDSANTCSSVFPDYSVLVTILFYLLR